MRFKATASVLTLGGVVGLAVLASGAIQQPPRQAGDPLVQEVRQLREAIERHASLSGQIQLTVQRGNLVQMRLSSLGWELADVRNQLARASEQLARDTALVQELDEQREHPEAVAGYLDAKRRLGPGQKAVQDLRAREADAAALLGSEQARWDELSRRLDQIERLIASRKY